MRSCPRKRGHHTATSRGLPRESDEGDAIAAKRTDKPKPSRASGGARTKRAPKAAAESGESPQAATAPGAEFPVVGIGASAGGLAAFEAFFSGMPADSEPGMAFVLVQHLAPDHKSILTDLVQRYTRMQVHEVEDGMTVRPNCAYIIPPGRDMAFEGGALHLLEPSAPRGRRMPIDFFFRSLALDQHERAIGIVLSGTGSDGTLGVRAIKGEGGMVMVQNPASTDYDGMPRSALGTGLVDYELPPAEMPPQLIAYAVHAFGRPHPPPTTTPPKPENALRKIFILLRTHTGNDFSQYKPSTVHRRIDRRMAIHQIESMDGYLKYLEQTPAEVEALFRDMLIGVTNFFRDPEAFQAVRENVIPALFSGKPPDSAIRIWSAGCSTGEEAYSLAILMAEHLEATRQNFRVQIFATDIDSQSIVAARGGIYPASIAADIAPERMSRYFTVEPDGTFCRIHKNIRDMLVFSEQNLIRDPPFSKLDLISCRNLLIYMDAALQRKIIPLFHYALNPGGVLFLGNSETVGEFGNLFATLDRKWKLYRRLDESHHASRVRIPPAMTRTESAPPRPAHRTAQPGNPPLREMTEQALLKHLAPVAALVNNNGDILYLHGRTGLFLEPAPGEAGVSNILNMAREGLRLELVTALHRAAGDGAVIRSPNLRVKSNGEFTTVNLTVRPVSAAPAAVAAAGPAGTFEGPLFLIILEEPPPSQTAVSAPSTPQLEEAGGVLAGDDEARSLIASLRQELRAKDEYLQTTNEELETANEELRSSNEEMQSVNEELQSTNEELETSKEELQSVNEELSTVNAELQTKVADLTRANNDMNNLLSGTGIATVFVDHGLRIMRFTPAATRIINLIQSDIGRPAGHIVSNLVGYDSLPADMQAVLDTLAPKEVEVRTKVGAWYTMRILPYRTLDNVIEGAVITFVDITTAKQAQEDLHKAHVRVVEAISDTVRDPLVVLDPDARVLSANHRFFSTFRMDPESTVGQLLYDVGNRRWDVPALRELLEQTLPRDGAIDDHVISLDRGDPGSRTLRISARMVGETGQSGFILLAIEDITGQGKTGRPT
jgi:two-component system, chemotaxis family, CheB/CheR fusion protein